MPNNTDHQLAQQVQSSKAENQWHQPHPSRLAANNLFLKYDSRSYHRIIRRFLQYISADAIIDVITIIRIKIKKLKT